MREPAGRDGQYRMRLAPPAAEKEELLERLLESFQTDLFGGTFLTTELLSSVCETLREGLDVELRRKKNCVDVIRLERRRVETGSGRHLPAPGAAAPRQTGQSQLAMPGWESAGKSRRADRRAAR